MSYAMFVVENKVSHEISLNLVNLLLKNTRVALPVPQYLNNLSAPSLLNFMFLNL